jgi:succinoglycan biosynthesis transport protein ExoP
MPEVTAAPASHTSTTHAVRHHLGWVLVCLLLGATIGWFSYTSAPSSFTSTARVLVNPSSGNPFVPSPSSVRQDEPTSLETEAQVLRSTEVLAQVVQAHPQWTIGRLQRNLSVLVPPNTQILEISYTAGDRAEAQAVTQAVADAFLANRAQRHDDVTGARIARIEDRTAEVVAQLGVESELAQKGSDAEKLFHLEMVQTLRNELVSLRAQRTALDHSEAPAGTVIAPASAGASATGPIAIALPVGLALAGLALGCLVAVVLERLRGRVRSDHDVEVLGVPVVAAVPAGGLLARLRRTPDPEATDTTVRRLRATILDLDPRPDVIAVAPVGADVGDAAATETVALSFAKAGHSVVLVRADLDPTGPGLGLEEHDGLSQMLMYERMNALELLQPTVEPLLSVLPGGGSTAQARELLVADRLRAVLAPLTEAGHLVVVQAAGTDSPEGEAATGASDLSIVVVTQGRTSTRAVERVATLRRRAHTPVAALVVDRTSFLRRQVHETHDDRRTDTTSGSTLGREKVTRDRQ